LPTTRSVPPPGPLYQHRQAWPFADCPAAGIDPARLGGRGIGIHSLPKTAINDAIRNGATMHEVREFAGHADIRTTEVYTSRGQE
jgi:integrase